LLVNFDGVAAASLWDAAVCVKCRRLRGRIRRFNSHEGDLGKRERPSARQSGSNAPRPHGSGRGAPNRKDEDV